MDRTERLLDLVTLFLDAREPITWPELREAFPDDYGGSDEAAERKFERDKAELLELGIPVRYVQGDDEQRDGYSVDREAYYLPEVGLTPEELAVLYAAGSAALASGAFPGRQDLEHALRKVGFFAGGQLPTPRVRLELGQVQGGPELAPILERLWQAASTRKWVQVSYWSPRGGQVTDRRVDPYGLALRQGIWSLVGYCHLRKDIRTFHVHRIRDLVVNAGKPRSPDFEVPATFKLDDYVASQPWQYRFHEPVDVVFRLEAELTAMAERIFPGSRVERAGPHATATVRATYLDGLIRYALSLGAACRVIGPVEAREKLRAMASRVADAHGVDDAQAIPRATGSGP